MDSWYTMPLAWVAAAVIALVLAANAVAYRWDHHQTSPTVSVAAVRTLDSTALTLRLRRTAAAQSRSDLATAEAIQTEAAAAVAVLRARVTGTAEAAIRAHATARARRRQVAAAHARATSVARIQATLTAASIRWQRLGPYAGVYELLDTVNGVRATVEAPQAGGASRRGPAPFGSMYLWFAAAEHNGSRYQVRSSASHFSMVSSTGTVYRHPALDRPPASRVNHRFRPAWVRPHGSNGGSLRFQIPSSPYTYALLWQESGGPPQAICHLQVGSGGRVALTP